MPIKHLSDVKFDFSSDHYDQFKRYYATRYPGAHLSVEWFIFEIDIRDISPQPQQQVTVACCAMNTGCPFIWVCFGNKKVIS